MLLAQAQVRYPVYGEADIVVETGDAAHQVSVEQVIAALTAFFAESAA